MLKSEWPDSLLKVSISITNHFFQSNELEMSSVYNLQGVSMRNNMHISWLHVILFILVRTFHYPLGNIKSHYMNFYNMPQTIYKCEKIGSCYQSLLIRNLAKRRKTCNIHFSANQNISHLLVFGILWRESLQCYASCT